MSSSDDDSYSLGSMSHESHSENSYSDDSYSEDSWSESEECICQGMYESGAPCRLTSKSKSAAAESLRHGLDYCDRHFEQTAFVFCEDDADSADDSDDERPLKEKDFRGLAPPFFGRSDYGLAPAYWPRRPTVPKEYSLPSWARRCGNGQDPSLCGDIRSFSSFIVHRPSKAVVGWMQGQIVRRPNPDLVVSADEHSSDLYWLVENLFTEDDYRLRPELKRGSIWGDSLDVGRFLVIDTVELVEAHRGKRVLSQLHEALRSVCVEWGTRCVFAEVLMLQPRECRLLPSSHTARRDSLHKLRDSFASMGFRRIGITDYMAMVVDPAHKCWWPATHKPPEFPFREVAKTVSNAEFRPLLEQCVNAECASRNESRRQITAGDDHWKPALVLREATLGIDALLAHDPKGLFDINEGQQYSMPAKLLHNMLSRQEAVWKRTKLSAGIRDLVAKLAEKGHPMESSRR